MLPSIIFPYLLLNFLPLMLRFLVVFFFPFLRHSALSPYFHSKLRRRFFTRNIHSI